MKIRVIALIILIVGITAGFFDFAQFTKFGNSFWSKPFRLGLDLQGGTHLVYRADVSSLASSTVNDAMASLRDVIERRINLFGVSEPVVQVENVAGDQRLIVELAGVFDIKEAIKIIGETPFLEFKEIKRDASGKISVPNKDAVSLKDDFVSTNLNGRYVQRATLDFDRTSGIPTVALEFTSEGGKIFEDITARNIGKPLAIFLDGSPISAPTVNEKIAGGRAQLTGRFSVDEAQQLVRRFNAGALPVPISLISQQSVESSLGHDSLRKSLGAGMYGTLLIMLFMILWYRLPGVIAVCALGVYASLTLLLFKLIPVTLSSAGIAGFILSIGMGVDANILIFERMKEEVRSGKQLETAMTEGFKRAWTSIRDSNVSSLITSVILYWFGTSVVRGFALTLGLGILVSMFSSITASRYFLRSLPHAKENKFTKFIFGSGISR